MKAIKLKYVKEGDFFKLRPTDSAPIWIKGSYYPFEKMYECYEYKDISHYTYFPTLKIVYIDFEF